MRIGMDVRYLSHGLVGGIHTFQKNLVRAIGELPTDHEFLLYVDDKRQHELPTGVGNMVVRTLPYRGKLSSVRYDLLMRGEMAKDNLDVFYFAGNYGFGPKGATVMTLQDEINVMPLASILRGHNKAPRTVAMMTYLHYFTAAAVHRADRVVTISEYSRSQILKHTNLDPSRITVVHHGCPVDIHRVDDPQVIGEVTARLGIGRPFILAEAFKNPDVIVRSWQRLPEATRSQFEIVFFSRSAEVLPSVAEAVDKGWAHLFVRPARSDLAALFSAAVAFVFPSWIEGFGIPLVEAMTCGAPIIASNRAAIPEIVGDAALLIEAADDESLARNLVRLLVSAEERSRLRSLGLARSKQFTWHQAALQYLSVFEQMGAARLHEAQGER